MKVKDPYLQVPEVAWPTVLVFTISWVLWATFFYSAYIGVVSFWIALPFMSLFTYLLFTPLHDSVHKSVFRSKFANDLIGRFCGIPLMAPFVAFRYCHLEHHKYTNVLKKDPDLWAGMGQGIFSRLFHWLTLDLHYYGFYLPILTKRPMKERIEAALGLGVNAALLIYGIAFQDWKFLILLLVPARVATAALAFAFDFLPHYPHKVTSEENRYLATSNFGQEWTGPLLMYQNYHLSHHLFPGVPFYRYKLVWKAKEQELLSKGCKIRSIFDNRIMKEG